ncbi:hypothetical protein RRG08_057999 [Elysia crispata]|uniref:Uncharacterized protein n=1 Tax=Elysia crispata TaxID=231223 RepID=A0AAE1D7L4_9GAST|nr:hypothetical protein RRG08_057999 [Elysia crispata]
MKVTSSQSLTTGEKGHLESHGIPLDNDDVAQNKLQCPSSVAANENFPSYEAKGVYHELELYHSVGSSHSAANTATASD